MANEFIDFSSGWSNLSGEEFCELAKEIFVSMKDAAIIAKAAADVDPTPENIQLSQRLSKRFVVLVDMMRCGNALVKHRIDDMHKQALEKPNDPENAVIIGLANKLNGVTDAGGQSDN
jgi:hypothetical protein